MHNSYSTVLDLDLVLLDLVLLVPGTLSASGLCLLLQENRSIAHGVSADRYGLTICMGLDGQRSINVSLDDYTCGTRTYRAACKSEQAMRHAVLYTNIGILVHSMRGPVPSYAHSMSECMIGG